MERLLLSENKLSGTPPLAQVAWFGSTSQPLASKTSSFALAGSIPTEFGNLINKRHLYVDNDQLTGTAPIVHFNWFGSTSLPLAFKTSSLRWQGQSPPNSASSSICSACG
jgi:hypothetical protein